MDDVISILVPTYPGGGAVRGHDITRIIVNGFEIDMRSLRAFNLTSHVSEETNINLTYNPIKDMSYRTLKNYMGYTVLIEAPSGPPKAVFVNGYKIVGKNSANRNANGFWFRFNLFPGSVPHYYILYNEAARRNHDRYLEPEYFDENMAGDW
jgi:hypothetical protein